MMIDGNTAALERHTQEESDSARRREELEDIWQDHRDDIVWDFIQDNRDLVLDEASEVDAEYDIVADSVEALIYNDDCRAQEVKNRLIDYWTPTAEEWWLSKQGDENDS